MADKKKTKSVKKPEISIAIVGMPNVGKSSLTNALLKKERSIVIITEKI